MSRAWRALLAALLLSLVVYGPYRACTRFLEPKIKASGDREHTVRPPLSAPLSPTVTASPSPLPQAIAYTPESFRQLRFFGASGEPLAWYYRNEKGDYELFDAPGRHPRYGVKLRPITGQVVREIERVMTAAESAPADGKDAREEPVGDSSEGARAELPESPPPPVPAGPVEVTVHSGTELTVALDHAIATDRNRPQQEFRAKLAAPLMVGSQLVAREGALAYGRILSLSDVTRSAGAVIRLQIDSIEVGDQQVPLVSRPLTIAREKTSGSKKGLKILGGAILGAVVGAAVDGKEGAAKGAVIGAGAGTATAVLTRGGKSIELPAHTVLRFETATSTMVTAHSQDDESRAAKR